MLGGVLIGCGGATPSTTAFWDALRITGADEAEGWATLREMKAASDIVGVGTLVSFEFSRTVQGGSEDATGYGKASLRMTETISGVAPGGLIPVEFLLGGSPETFEQRASDIGRSLPDGELLVFLREKGGQEAGLFRLVNSTGLWASTVRAAVDAPLSDTELGSPYAGELGAARTFDELVAYVTAQ